MSVPVALTQNTAVRRALHLVWPYVFPNASVVLGSSEKKSHFRPYYTRHLVNISLKLPVVEVDHFEYFQEQHSLTHHVSYMIVFHDVS